MPYTLIHGFLYIGPGFILTNKEIRTTTLRIPATFILIKARECNNLKFYKLEFPVCDNSNLTDCVQLKCKHH